MGQLQSGNPSVIDVYKRQAYRYTEARMSKLADEMLRDIEKDLSLIHIFLPREPLSGGPALSRPCFPAPDLNPQEWRSSMNPAADIWAKVLALSLIHICPVQR